MYTQKSFSLDLLRREDGLSVNSTAGRSRDGEEIFVSSYPARWFEEGTAHSGQVGAPGKKIWTELVAMTIQAVWAYIRCM